MFKVISYIFYTIVAIIALLLIIPLFPLPGNYQIFTVLSGSMEPEIHTGSVVIVKPVDNYEIDDVITFGKTKKTPTTHRIHDIQVSVGNPIYKTKGDANNAPDSTEITKDEVIGKVLLSVPYAGFVISTAKKPWRFALIIIIPALIIISDEIKKIWLEIKKMKGKKEEEKDS